MYFAVVIIMCKLKLNSTMANLVPDVIAITPVYQHTTGVVGMSCSIEVKRLSPYF